METKRGPCVSCQAVKLVIESNGQFSDQWCIDLPFLFSEEFAVTVAVHFRFTDFCISTDKQITSRKPKSGFQKHPNRSKVLQAGVEWLVHQRELQRQAQSNTRHRKEVTLPPVAVKYDINGKVNVGKDCSTTRIVLYYFNLLCCSLQWYAFSLSTKGPTPPY